MLLDHVKLEVEIALVFEFLADSELLIFVNRLRFYNLRSSEVSSFSNFLSAHFFGFGTVYIVGANDVAGLLQTFFDGIGVIGGAILAQEVFENVCRYGKVAFYLEGQVLADDLADESVEYLVL